MRRTLAALLVAAVGPVGCAPSAPPAPVAEPATPSVAPVAPVAPGPLPAPEALTGVLSRLADPALPGADKLPLVAGASAADAATLDRFAAALRDGGYTPATFTAAGIRWSPDAPAAQPRVLADITVSAPGAASGAKTGSGPGPFSFPMEFEPAGGGWQLTRDTAEMLFAFGEAR